MVVGRIGIAIGFWTGILLPLLYLPIFLLGVDSATRFSAVLALLVIHAVALVVGHSYPETRSV